MESYLGTVILFAGDYAPKNFAICNGQQLKVDQYAALYSVIGHKYGGNRVYFNLPNLPAPEGFISIICVEGLFPERAD